MYGTISASQAFLRSRRAQLRLSRALCKSAAPYHSRAEARLYEGNRYALQVELPSGFLHTAADTVGLQASREPKRLEQTGRPVKAPTSAMMSS